VPTVFCSGCGQQIPIPGGIGSGEILHCPNWAGLTLRAGEKNGLWSVTAVKTASCAVGEETLILPDDVQPGDIIECHGVKQRVTYAFGVYALEKIGKWPLMTKEPLWKSGLWGTIVTAICCVTPVLPWALGFIGLVVLVPYLDYVLFPLLGLFLGMMIVGWRRGRGARPACETACETPKR
jgi:mercuric ion transport protein